MNLNPSDADRGVYKKFRVERTNGSSAEGGRHFGCEYFVLDLIHDPFAVPALYAYADACARTFPALAADLLRWLENRDTRLVPE